MKKVIIKVGGMTCSACSSGLEKYLNKQDGINAASVNLVMNNVSIEYDEQKLTIENLNKYIDKAGFEGLGIDTFKKEERKKGKQKINLIIISVFAILALYISMGHMIGMPSIPYLSAVNNPLNYALSLFIISIIVMFLGRDLIKNGLKNLVHLTPNMDTLVTIGVFASFIFSLFSTFEIYSGKVEYVHELYFESCAVIIFFIKIGKYIEGKNKDKTKEALQDLMTITPSLATIIKNNKEKTVTLDEIKKGDIVVCRPGEKIAVDGEILSGSTHIDESFITGESVPVKREKGSKVIAGSINYEGRIEYKAERIGKESAVSEIVRMVAEATNTKAPISKIADKVSGVFVPVVIVISILAFIVWYIISKDVSIALNVFISVLVVACPCSLGLATPLAIVIASGLCSKKGILVKTSETLENSHKVKTIVLDKTGTITNGKLTVTKIFNYSNKSDDEILKICSSIEKYSEHPIARAIIDYAIKKNIELLSVENFEALPGYGVRANVGNYEYIIGNRKYVEKMDIEIPTLEDEDTLVKDGNSILYLASNDNVLALFGVKDTIKDNAKVAIDKFIKRGINVVMLTGDNEKTAMAVAKQVGITKVIANVLPKEKAQKIKELKQDGIVLMCGDGINDSISLVNADIGVSISSATDIAIDSSSVVIMNDNLDRINDLIYISDKTIKNIKQNLFWAFIYNILMIPVALGLFKGIGVQVNPMIASLAMTLSSFTVVVNALRLKLIK